MPVFVDLANKTVRPLKKRDGTMPPPVSPARAPAPPIKMRIRILQTIRGSRQGNFLAGQFYDLPLDVARSWIESGLAEFDKMLDGAPETK
jgi:hypothetical protein